MTEAAASPGAIQRGSLEKAKRMKPFGIFDFAWRRVPLIIGFGLPIFVALSVLFRFFASPVYEVNAKVLITPTKAPSIDGRDRELIQGDVGWFARTLVLRLTNPNVLRDAIRKIPEDERPDFLRGLGDTDRAVFRLMSRLKALEVQRTYMIEVSMDGGEPGGLAETLNAVLDTFVEKLENEQERQYLSQLNYLKGERDRIAERVRAEKQSLFGITKTLDTKVVLSDGYTGHLDKQRLIQNLYWAAQGVALDRKAKFEQAENDKTGISKLDITPFADAEVANFLGINQMEQWTYVETQNLRKTIDGMTPENPDRKNVEARMKSMLEYLTVYKNKVATDTLNTFRDKKNYELDEDVLRAKNSYDASVAAANDLKAELDQADIQASKIAEAMFQASEHVYGVEQFRERLASIEARIDDAELEAKAPLPVLIDQRALEPEKPASTNASKLQMAALVLSFGFIGGLCVVFDFFDPRVRTRAELGAAIGGPGCEPVPALLAGGAEDPAFPDILAGDSPAAAAIRDFAVRLIAEQASSKARVIDFVGIHPRAGNSSLALLAARALTAHGLRVLVAELPGRDPGLAARAGLSDPDALVPGPWAAKTHDPASAADLIPWTRQTSSDGLRASLAKFLENARAAYDFVLLDSPALKESDLAHECALSSDVVVLTAKQDVGIFGDARAIVDWCAAGNVPAITAWLNFAAPDPVRAWAEKTLRDAMDLLTRVHTTAAGFALKRVAPLVGGLASLRKKKP